MKQTLTTTNNYRATVQIPASRFPQKETNDCCGCSCDQKIVYVGAQNTNNHNSNNREVQEALFELQKSYDEDMKNYQIKITRIEEENSRLRNSFLQIQKQHRNVTSNLTIENSNLKGEITILKQQLKQKDGEIAKLQKEKQVILRNKVIQFKQMEINNQVMQLRRLLELKDLELRKKDEVIRILKDDEKKRNSDLNIYRDEVEMHKRNLNQMRNNNDLERTQNQSAFKGVISKFEEENKWIKNGEVQLRKQLDCIRIQNSYLQQQIKEKEILVGKLEKSQQTSILKEKIEALHQQLSSAYSQIHKLKQSISKIKCQQQKNDCDYVSVLKECKQAQLDLTTCKQLYLQLQQSKEIYINEIARLREQLSAKDKTYEVRVERVIDGSSQIEELKLKIAEFHNYVDESKRRMKALEIELAKKDDQLGGEKALVVKLKHEIVELKSYIEKKEKSFIWSVENSIRKDVEYTGHSQQQVYRVANVKETINKEYSPAKYQANQNIGQTIAEGMNMSGFGMNQGQPHFNMPQGQQSFTVPQMQMSNQMPMMPNSQQPVVNPNPLNTNQ